MNNLEKFYSCLLEEGLPIVSFSELHNYCDPNAVCIDALDIGDLPFELQVERVNFFVELWEEYLPEFEPILLLASNWGVYIPYAFYKYYGNDPTFFNINQQCLKGISDINNSDYWDCWEDIVDCAEMRVDGKSYFLVQDADLFAYRKITNS